MRWMWMMGATGAGLAAAAWLFAWGPTGGVAADAPYRLAAVDRGPITASVRATGSVNPVTTVLVGSQMSGRVVEILVDYNSPVTAGQVLARLDSEQIKTRRDAALADVAGARADLDMRRAQAERARATRARADATLRDQQAGRERTTALLAEARRGLERQTELSARNVGSQTALDSARTQAEVQRAGLASSEAQIAAARAELGGLEADIALADAQIKSAEAVVLQRQAKLRDIEIDLARTDIRSPVDGVVVQRQIDLGQTVAASLQAPTLFTVAQDLRRIDIHASIDESDVGRLKPGQEVTFTVNAYPNRTYAGTVRLVRLGAQTVQNVVTYTAIIGVENRDLTLLPGMTATLQVVTDERRDALRVPNAALRFRPPGAPAAAGAEAPAAGPRSGRPMEVLRERLAGEVRPTPEQTAAIETILAEARAAFPGRAPGLSDEERRAAMRAARADLQARIAAALDPERRARFEAAMAEGPRGGRGGSPGRVFVLDEAGQPKAVPVTLGVTDGSHTEILAGDLAEGASLAVGGGPRAAGGSPNSDASPAARPRGPRLF